MTVDELMEVLWEAHTGSIVYAMSIFTAELIYLASSQEQKFGIGWGNFVQIIAAARFVTNATEVHSLQVNLPYRMLNEDDTPGKIKDFTESMNEVCEAMFDIYHLHNTSIYRLFIHEWDKVMENVDCRAKAQVMINNFFHSPTKEIISMLFSLVEHCK
eukprot:TRINITY_DN2390_c0_g1_i1.p2 TRINITY_DN2390_c0_g1~~TRINITY_DN2390_c0_g1_i1.p2  ORF type:complete len:158 (+),score=30.17 TRINITY_DN2390_c0_g1_i1:540-1013(+)